MSPRRFGFDRFSFLFMGDVYRWTILSRESSRAYDIFGGNWKSCVLKKVGRKQLLRGVGRSKMWFDSMWLLVVENDEFIETWGIQSPERQMMSVWGCPSSPSKTQGIYRFHYHSQVRWLRKRQFLQNMFLPVRLVPCHIEDDWYPKLAGWPGAQLWILQESCFHLNCWTVGNTITRWWQLKYFLIFTPIWGRLPFWLIFFKGVETTNQIISISFGWSKVWVAARSVADGPLQARTSQDPWFSMSFLEMRRCLLGRFTLVYILGFFCFIGGWTHHV